jgi:hypothetical protein
MRLKPRRRRGKPVPIGQELTSVMRRIGQGQRGVHPELWARWGEIVGWDLGKRAFPRRLKGALLVVSVSSSAWMQELSFIKDALIEKIGQEVGPDIVSDIRFVLDTTLPALPSRTPPKQATPPALEKSGQRSIEIDNALTSVEDDELRGVIDRAVKANLGE